jgi:hypothetical protein
MPAVETAATVTKPAFAGSGMTMDREGKRLEIGNHRALPVVLTLVEDVVASGRDIAAAQREGAVAPLPAEERIRPNGLSDEMKNP